MKTNYRRQHNHQRRFSRVLLLLLALSLIFAVLSGTGALTSIMRSAYIYTNIGINKLEKSTQGISTVLSTKPALVKENQKLRSTIKELRIAHLYSNTLRLENTELRRLLNATKESSFSGKETSLARVIGYQNIPYGTLLVSTQEYSASPPKIGDLARFGEWAIGTVAKITNGAALISLFTSSDNTYDVLIGDAVATFFGTSNGTGKLMLSRDLNISAGMPITLPSANGLILGSVKAVVRNDEESLQTVLVRTPFNINALRFIIIESQ